MIFLTCILLWQTVSSVYSTYQSKCFVHQNVALGSISSNLKNSTEKYMNQIISNYINFEFCRLHLKIWSFFLCSSKGIWSFFACSSKDNFQLFVIKTTKWSLRKFTKWIKLISSYWSCDRIPVISIGENRFWQLWIMDLF